MAVRLWQKSRRIYVRPRTGPQSAHLWWLVVAIANRAAARLGSYAMGQTDGRIAVSLNAPLRRGHNKRTDRQTDDTSMHYAFSRDAHSAWECKSTSQEPDLQNILRQSYDSLTIMLKLRSTYDGRLICKTSYEERTAFSGTIHLQNRKIV